MKKTLLLFCGILLGISAFGQTTQETKAVLDKSELSTERQIADLEDMIKRFGETHEESIKAKAMIEVLRKNESEKALQERMKETLSPAEYDAWKAKHVAELKNKKSLNHSEEKKQK